MFNNLVSKPDINGGKFANAVAQSISNSPEKWVADRISLYSSTHWISFEIDSGNKTVKFIVKDAQYNKHPIEFNEKMKQTIWSAYERWLLWEKENELNKALDHYGLSAA